MGRAGTPFADEHGIYDPADTSDRMVLGVRGHGRRMCVTYGGHRSARGCRTMQYRCFALRNRMAGQDCQLIGGKRIDQLVAEEFLEVTRPAAIEAAQRASELVERQAAETERYWALQIEKADYEAERARRQYDAVEPENRQVVRSLERRWNDRLRDLETARSNAQQARTRVRTLTETELERTSHLAHDLAEVWNAATTTNRDRKRLLRCAIEEVQLNTESDTCHVRIVWKGGAISDREIERRTPASAHATSEDIVDLVRKLAEEQGGIEHFEGPPERRGREQVVAEAVPPETRQP